MFRGTENIEVTICYPSDPVPVADHGAARGHGVSAGERHGRVLHRVEHLWLLRVLLACIDIDRYR